MTFTLRVPVTSAWSPDIIKLHSDLHLPFLDNRYLQPNFHYL